MKMYNYLLFRMYKLFSRGNATVKDIDFFLTVFSTFIIVISIQCFLYTWYYYFYTIAHRDNNNFIEFLLPILILASVNYYFFIQKHKFLNYGFKEDKKGGIVLILFLCFIFINVTYMSFKNKNRISQENEKLKLEKQTEIIDNRKPSLEGKIRKWLES